MVISEFSNCVFWFVFGLAVGKSSFLLKAGYRLFYTSKGTKSIYKLKKIEREEFYVEFCFLEYVKFRSIETGFNSPIQLFFKRFNQLVR